MMGQKVKLPHRKAYSEFLTKTNKKNPNNKPTKHKIKLQELVIRIQEKFTKTISLGHGVFFPL